MPDPPPEIDAATLANVRAQSEMSQRVFARMLNVSPKTVQSWEQGVRRPSDASRRLLQVFCEEPEILCRIAGLPVVHLSGIRTKTLASGVRKIVVSR
jgi:DNA-binding transcriptional regulator YiaG